MNYYFDKLRPLALLLLRCNLALIFLYSGYHKYSNGIAGVQAYMTSLGLPSYFAYLNLAIELGGGVLLLLGFGTRIVAFLVAIQMGVALWAQDLAAGVKAVPNYQFPLLVGVAALVLVSTGAGSISLDSAFLGGGGRSKGKSRG